MDELVDHLAEAFEAVDPVMGDLVIGHPVVTGAGPYDVGVHLVGEMRRCAALVRGSPPPAGDELSGADLLESYRAAAYDAVAAFGEPWVLTRAFPGPGGTENGFAVARALLCEALGHGSDLARATGRTLRVRDRIIEVAGAPLDQIADGLGCRARWRL